MFKLERLRKAHSKRVLSLFLVAVMLVGLTPAYALEAEDALELKAESQGPYLVGSEVNVHVAAPEGAAVFFAYGDEEPTEQSSAVSGDSITVTSDEAGVVKLNVLAVVGTETAGDSELPPEGHQTGEAQEERVPNAEDEQAADVPQNIPEANEGDSQVADDAQDNQESIEEDNQTTGESQNGQDSAEGSDQATVEVPDGQSSTEVDDQTADESPDDQAVVEEDGKVADEGQSDQEPSPDDEEVVNAELDAQESDDGGKQTTGEEDPAPAINKEADEASSSENQSSDNCSPEEVPVVNSIFRSVGIGMGAAAMQSSMFFLNEESEGDVNSEEDGLADVIKKIYYRASLELEFVEEPKIMLLADGTPAAPTLTLTEDKKIYSLSEEAEIQVTLPEGVTDAYYTTDGSTPTKESTKVSNGTITVKIPTGDVKSQDGGIVTVKVVSAITNEGDTIYSATPAEAAISFYDTNRNNNDTFSLVVGESTYYFDDAENAFNALKDGNIEGAVTLSLERDASWSPVATNTAGTTCAFFSGSSPAITEWVLDLAGHQLTLNGPTDKMMLLGFMKTAQLSSFTITDTTDNGSVTGVEEKELGESAGQILLNNINLTVSIPTFTINNITIKSTEDSLIPAQILNTTSTNVDIRGSYFEGNCSATVIKCNTANVEDTTIVNTGSGYGFRQSGTIVNCKITAQNSAALYLSGQNNVVIGGSYEGTSAINVIGKVTLQNGVFNGGIVGSGTAVVSGEECYVKGSWTAKKDITGYSEYTVADGTYKDYVSFKKIEAHTATFKVVNKTDSAEIPYVVDIVAKNAEGTELESFENILAGTTISWTATCKKDYTFTGKVIYCDGTEEKELTGSDFSVSDDSSQITYTAPMPDYDFTLKFEVEFTGTSQTPIVQIGENSYTSLTNALANLKANDTLTLLEDTTWDEALEFNQENVTLDLKGKTLTLNVTAQSSNLANSYSILVSSGSLTIEDTLGNGRIFLNENDISGIRVGNDATLNYKGGLLTGLSNLAAAYSITCTGKNAKVNFSGGEIDGRINVGGQDSLLTISDGAYLKTVDYGMAIVAFPGNIVITGGEIYADAQSSVGTELGVINLVSGGLKMTDGSLICEGSAPAIRVTANGGVVELSGDAEIEAKNSSALSVQGTSTVGVAAKASVTVSAQAKIKGAHYAIEIENQEKEQIPSINISGGYFSCGEGYLPISDTYYVTYPGTDSTDKLPDKVLNLREKASDGYVGLVAPDSLKGTYKPSEGTGIEQELDYTYQDFKGVSDGSNSGLEQLLETTKTIYNAGNTDGKYPGDVWATFESAYELAKRLYDSNRNANQDEIDYRATALSSAMIELNAVSDIDPATMRDGTYEIQVGLWKSDMTTPSMSNGALDSTAILTKANGQYTLTMNFGPTYQYTVYGHLEDFYIYNGSDVNEGKINMTNDKDNNSHSTAKEAEYSNWYKGSSTDDSQIFSKDVLKEDRETAEYDLPGTVTVTLPYIGTSNDKRSYWVGMTVDAMGGYASAILMLSWGTLEEVSTQSTLNISHENLDLLKSEEFKVTAEVLNETGWDFNWSSDKENIATVTGGENGEATIKAGSTEDTATITVTASKDGQEALTRDIIVKVKPGTTKMEGSVTTSGDTAEVTISGDAVVTSSETVSIEVDRIVIDATTSNPNSVDSADISVSKASMQALDVENKTVTVKTDAGVISLDEDVVEEAAADTSGDTIRLIMKKTSIPDIDGLSSGDMEAAYDLELYYGARRVSNLGGEITIAVPWSDDVGYAYYYNEDTMKLDERFSMSNAGDGLYSWITDHFSTWVLSTDRNLMDVGITEGVYSVPIVIKQADAPSRDSMANDAVGDMVVADVDEDGVTYTMFLKARIGDELGGEPLRGHLLKMWYYAPDDTSRSNPIRATVVRTYEDRDMNGDMDTFPREVEVYQEGEPNEDYYIQVSVDAMGGDSALQDALVRLDWDNALDDGGEAAREGFEDEYAIEQVIDSGASVSRSDLSDWIDNENILLVQGRDDDLTARFDTDALEDLYDQTSSSIKFVLEEVRTSKLTDEQQETAGDRPVYQLKLTSSGDNITDIGDGNVEVTLPYELDDGEVADGLVIWLLDEDGTHSKIKCSYSERGKTVSFDTTEFGVFVIGYDAEQIWENPFTDVKEDDWFYEAVKYVVQKGLFAGTSETTFEPNLAMTRGMLVTVLYRLEGTPAVTGSSTFADVAPGQYYTSAVIWATQNGIVSGYGNGYFGTNDIVSREQMATILFRYAKSKDYDTSLVKDIGGFTDSDQVASYAKRALQWAYANGIIGGTSETTLSPKGSATRSQVATILMRFDEKIIVPAQEKAAKEAAEAEK